MRDFNTYKSEAIILCDETARMATNMGQQETLKVLQKAKTRLQKKDIYVLVCGEMKRGKSSLLGALLEEPDLFPTDVNVATNAITIVSYGEEEKIEVVLEQDEENDGNEDSFIRKTKLVTKIIQRGQIKDYVTEQGNCNNFMNTRLLKIQLPNEKLKTGLVFIDTPGVGSLNQNHAEVTYGYLPNADVLLFIGDAFSPFTETELTFLEAAYKYCKTILYPLTKIDKSSEVEVIAEANRNKISQLLNITKEEIEIIPVSSVNKFSRNKVLKQKSNFEVLENTIWSTVYHKRSQILILPSVLETGKELSEMHNSLLVQLQALSKSSQEVQEMAEVLKSTMNDRKQLMEGAAEWKIQLNYELKNLGSDLTKEVQDQITSLQSDLALRAKQTGGKNRIEELLSVVNEGLAKTTYHSKTRIENDLNEIERAAREKLKLDVDVHKDLVEKIGFSKGTDIDVPGMSKPLDRAIAYGRNITFDSMGGAAALGAAATVIAGGIALLAGGPLVALAVGLEALQVGGAVGALLGSIRGIFKGKKVMRELDVPAIMTELNKYINLKCGDIKYSINKTITDATFEITQDLNQKLKKQTDVLEINIQNLQQNLKLSESQVMQKRASLQNQIGMASKLEQHATALIYEINKPSEESRKEEVNKQTSEDQKTAAAEGRQPDVKGHSIKNVPDNTRFIHLED